MRRTAWVAAGTAALDEEAPAVAGEKRAGSRNVSNSRGAATILRNWSEVGLGGCLGIGVTFQ